MSVATSRELLEKLVIENDFILTESAMKKIMIFPVFEDRNINYQSLSHIIDNKELTTIKYEKWEDALNGLFELQRKLLDKSWIFRGEEKASWKLETSLKRKCVDFPGKLEDPAFTEEVLCREFKRRYHHYSSSSPEEDDLIEWFSLMQHHGAPTRLLDFTYSIFIATYFALEKYDFKESEDACAIWAIDAKKTSDNCKILFEDHKEEYNFFAQPINKNNIYMFKNVINNYKHNNFAFPVNPYILTERIVAQKGVFMCPGNLTNSFRDNLDFKSGKKCSKVKVIKINLNFNSQEKRSALKWLYDMNITRATLFPGLDGFAKSLSIQPPPF